MKQDASHQFAKIRIEWGDKVLLTREIDIDTGSFSNNKTETDWSPPEGPKLSDLATGPILSTGLGLILSPIGFATGPFSRFIGMLLRNEVPIKVFVEGTLVGAPLSAFMQELGKAVYKQLKAKVGEKKAKKTPMLLYGPDGKEIKWDDDHK